MRSRSAWAVLVALLLAAAGGCGSEAAKEGAGDAVAGSTIAYLAPPPGAAAPDAVFVDPECDPVADRGDTPCWSSIVDVWLGGDDARRLTSSGGFLLDRAWFRGLWDRPAWSPDGSLLAVARTRVDGEGEDGGERQDEVWTVTPDGDARRVARGFAPAWSPDGGRLAVTVPQGDGASVAVVARDGTGLRVVARAGAFPAWTPDGERLLYQSLDKPSVWTVNTDGEPVQRKLVDGELAQPSPDGRWIAFWRTTPSSSALWVAGADGSRPRRLAALTQGGLAWSPDSRSLAVVAATYEHDWAGPLHLLAADGSGRRTLDQAAVGYPSWAPDGSALAFAKLGQPGQMVRQNRTSIHTIRPDGSGLTRVTRGLFDLHPAWRPATARG